MSPGPDAVSVPPANPPTEAVSPPIAPVPPAPAGAAAAGPPTGPDILRWVAAAGPKLWFPGEQARESGIPRADFDDPVWVLRQSGMIRVADWVKGRGQGFVLTPEGEAALADPAKLTAAPPPTPAPEPAVADRPASPSRSPGRHAGDDFRAGGGLTTFERGELARAAVLTPLPSVVAPALLFANVAWFMVGVVVAWRAGGGIGHYLKDGDVAVLLKIGAVSGGSLLAGEWWRLVTSMFVHVGIVHLFVNMFSLAVLGPVAESCWGRRRFAALYIVGGVAGSCLAMALKPNSALAGASGAIWAVQTALVVWLVRYREHLPEANVRAALQSLALVMFLNGGLSFAPGISWEGHLGGALVGAVGGILLDIARPVETRRGLWALAGFGLLAIAGPVGLLVAMTQTDDWRRLQAAADERARAAAWDRDTAGWRVAVSAVGDAAVKTTHTQATHALVTLNPDLIVSARESVATLAAGVAAAREKVTGSDPPSAAARAYLDEVDRFAAVLRDRLGETRIPSLDEWAAVSAQRAKVAAAWAALRAEAK